MNKSERPKSGPPIHDLVPEFGNALGGVLSATQALISGAEKDPLLRSEFLMGMERRLLYLRLLMDNWILLSAQHQKDSDEWLARRIKADRLSDFLSRQKHSKPGRRFQWHISLPDPFPEVHAPPQVVEQAIENILFTSMAVAPAASMISIHVQADEPEKRVWIEVCDSGPAISRQALAGLIRGEKNTSGNPRLADGHSLNLRLAQQIIVKLGGSLKTGTEKGRCCLRILIPSSP